MAAVGLELAKLVGGLCAQARDSRSGNKGSGPTARIRKIFHISYEGGILEDPWKEPPARYVRLVVGR